MCFQLYDAIFVFLSLRRINADINNKGRPFTIELTSKPPKDGGDYEPYSQRKVEHPIS